MDKPTRSEFKAMLLSLNARYAADLASESSDSELSGTARHIAADCFVKGYGSRDDIDQLKRQLNAFDVGNQFDFAYESFRYLLFGGERHEASGGWCNTEVYNKEYFTVEVHEENKNYFFSFKNDNIARYKHHAAFTVAILDFLHIEGV